MSASAGVTEDVKATLLTPAADEAQFVPMVALVLAQVHPGMSIAPDAQQLVASMLHGFLGLVLAGPAGDSEGLVKQIGDAFGGELGKHGMSEATKATTKFSGGDGQPASSGRASGLQANPVAVLAFSKRLRASLTLEDGVALAAACEYLSAEVLELGGNAAKDAGGGDSGKIEVAHLWTAIERDAELDGLAPRLVASSVRGAGPAPAEGGGAAASSGASGPSRVVTAGDSTLAGHMNRLGQAQLVKVLEFM